MNDIILDVKKIISTLPENKRELFIWELKKELDALASEERFKIMKKIFPYLDTKE
jgi:hypothetical protein